ncbi:MAG: hypothetical protein OXF31_07180, partial [Gammaproteobacteria bacterium]|nr:hypothetical protein [Gammaproteobacteria bacterium]
LPCFRPGHTALRLWIKTWDDAHDDPGETFEMVLSNPRGATIADAVAVGTITNDDPLPAAYLARFGRAAAEQALGGVAGRMAAERAPGLRGSFAGRPAGAGGAGEAASGAAAEDRSGVGAGAAGSGVRFGAGLGGMAPGQPPAARPGARPSGAGPSMGMGEALLNSSFTLTGAEDAAGGSLAFWGRASRSRFEGAERGEGTGATLDGEAATAMAGADYARGGWLVGLALTQSMSEGGYRAAGAGAPCPAAGPEGGAGDTAPVCAPEGLGEGRVEASLTAAVPYAAWRAGERLEAWGAAGVGAGGVTLSTMGESYSAGTKWRMAAAGLRGGLLGGAAGPALSVVSDALWARTESAAARGLAASDSAVTRLRLGLEGSWRFGFAGGGSLTPKVEVGARHDGGDAETGFGVELGGGLRWSEPRLGLALDVSGRTLLTHGDGDAEDMGLSAALSFDPAPATGLGPSLSLRQDMGGRASGGLDALFQSDMPRGQAGGVDAAGRWALEAAWGVPAFGGRFAATPLLGFGQAPGGRDFSLGWKLAPAEEDAPDLSLGVRAARREGGPAGAEHGLEIDLAYRW